MCAEAKTAHEETEGKCAMTSLLPQQPYCFRWGPSLVFPASSFATEQTAGSGESPLWWLQGSAELGALRQLWVLRGLLRCWGNDDT